MRYLEFDGKTVKVDVEAPDRLVGFSEWLRDADIPLGSLTVIATGVADLVCTLPEDVKTSASILLAVVELLFATILDYSVRTVQYLSASGQGWAFGNAEATITSN
ncbi:MULTISPECIES: hypothetical protein [Halobellus]|uniref:hypothetical protein n=1 Tax=Halobellus TaxID=1073986 RepID=UPI0021148D70|nr:MULTISPECIES: hypothetical protein [Halobellus]MDQ2054317.1 hypothetical protein [Halobellus sp. H-GB7]